MSILPSNLRSPIPADDNGVRGTTPKGDGSP
jgi:hypothetical protein